MVLLLLLPPSSGVVFAAEVSPPVIGTVVFNNMKSNVADPAPGTGAFLTPGSGMGKKSGSMNKPDHISESLETILWVKILKFFDAGPGSGMEKIRIRDGKIRIRDPGLTSRIRKTSVADPGCLSRIPDPDFYPSRIPDPKTGRKERGKKKFVKHFFVATNFTKCKIV